MRGDLPAGSEVPPKLKLALRQRIRWIDALAVAVVVVAVGTALVVLRPDKPAHREGVSGVATSTAAANQFTAREQQIVRLLPPGYTAGGCTRATNPFTKSIASLDCNQGTEANNPAYARFTLYDDLEAMTGDFQSTTDGMAVSPCPGGNTSPGAWSYGSNPGRIIGKIVCGSVADRPDIAWTRDAQLLLSTVNGGPDLSGLYQWWRRYGTLDS